MGKVISLNTKQSPEPRKPTRQIFHDPTRHRFFLVLFLAVVFGVAVAVWAVAFSYGLYRSNLTSSDQAGVSTAKAPVEVSTADSIADRAAPVAGLPAGDFSTAEAVGAGEKSTGPSWTAPDLEIHAFVPTWSLAAFASAESHIALIDVLMPEWHEIDEERAVLARTVGVRSDEFRRFVTDNRQGLELMPVVRLFEAHPDRVTEFLSAAELRGSLIASTVNTVLREDYDGICYNFSGSPQSAVGGLVNFATELNAALDNVQRDSCIIGTVDDPLWLQPDVDAIADRLIVLGFSEPGPYSAPAPLAPQGRFEEGVLSLVDELDASKLVVGIGNLGYGWKSGAPEPDRLGYFDVTGEAEKYGAEIRLDPFSLNTNVTYRDSTGTRHDIWLLDAISAHNQLLRIPPDAASGIAIWPLGSEDPGIWTLLDPTRSGSATAGSLLRVIPPAKQVRYTGAGPIVEIVTAAHEGIRDVELAQDSGLIVSEDYVRIPTATTIERRGTFGRNEIILSFDDGPDPKFTPQILDILKEYEVPAVFFVVGARVLGNQGIVRRMLADQHELGIHTFSHPSLEKVSGLRLKLELHAAQDVLIGVTGRNTTLFRSPYGDNYEGLMTKGETRILDALSSEGYVEVVGDVDSKDWTKPGVDAIVRKVISGLENGDGNVILMHDGGGDRSQAVAALRILIPTLLEQGYSFKTVGSILGSDVGTAVAPPPDDVGLFNFYSLEGLRLVGSIFTGLFFVTILAGLLRSLGIIVLALIRTRRKAPSGEFRDPVTVAIPAFCEESVIARSISRVLASSYPILEIIVIDDGSTDSTAKVVQDQFGSEQKVRLVRQANLGKAEALNHAIRIARSPVIVAIDADTIIAPDAIGLLVQHFSDPTVGAVAGNVKVGNRNNFLTRLQALEYITSQNLDRRAFDVINGIMVVPGSIGGWRKDALEAAGGYSSETLVEDADMTVSIVRAGYRVVYEPEARAYTEAPETVPQWVRQRLRWSFGMMQISWKHKAAFLERRAVGLVSIPDLAAFGILISILAPIADILFIMNLVRIAGILVEDPQAALSPVSIAINVAYLAYFLSDMLLAALAMSLEPDEDRRLLPWVLTQRFFYRQLYWFVALRSIGRVLGGRLAGWGKVIRTASVSPDEALRMPRASLRIVQAERIAPDAQNT